MSVPKMIFQSPKFRAQLAVFDIERYNNPEWRTVTYSVYVLPQTADRNTAYSIAGEIIYYGASLRGAIEAIEDKLKVKAYNTRIPKALQPYVEMAERGEYYPHTPEKEAAWNAHGRKLTEEYLERDREAHRKMVESWGK